MNLQTHDLHVMLDRTQRSCKVFAAGGQPVLECECRNRTVNDLAPPSERYAPCPPGEYVLGVPVPKNTPPFGPAFILISDYGDHHTMEANGRAGIGCHGGGSGLADWNAPRQSAFICTLGCFRFLNESLEELVRLVNAAHGAGGTVYTTVAPFTAGFPGAAGVPAAGLPDRIVPAEELDPDE